MYAIENARKFMRDNPDCCSMCASTGQLGLFIIFLHPFIPQWLLRSLIIRQMRGHPGFDRKRDMVSVVTIQEVMPYHARKLAEVVESDPKHQEIFKRYCTTTYKNCECQCGH